MVLIIGAYIEIYTNISHAQIWDNPKYSIFQLRVRIIFGNLVYLPVCIVAM